MKLHHLSMGMMLSTIGWLALVLAAPRADDAVAHVQSDLASLGIAPGPIDGIAGPLTRSAVARFQASDGLPATGEIDAGTRERLDDMIAALSAAIDAPRGAVAIDRPFVEETTDGDREEVIELYSAAQAESERLRLDAVRLLAGIATERAFSALRVVLYTNDLKSVRIAAAQALGHYRDLDSLYALAFALDLEKDVSVREAIETELTNGLPVELPPGIAAARDAAATRPVASLAR